ncbi:MAG: rRNA maturation RNase YbeY [Nitrospira sp.]|nr:rRNA maturation RNase YbeY [Nitrospira sp.]
MAVYLRVWLRHVAKQQASLVRAAESILTSVGESQSELSLELVGDRRMRRLNRMYRKKDRTTDVLAFPMRDIHAGVRQGARGKRPRVKRKMLPSRAAHLVPDMLGDVVISVPTARRQAHASGRSLGDELAALLVHGVLHLCGYDHERSAREAVRMRRRETAIVNMLNPVPRLVIRRVGRRVRTH